MRKIHLRGRSTSFPLKKMWQRIATLEDYPHTIKFCKSIQVSEFKEGSSFTDVTTLLWIPITIYHDILTIKREKELSFFSPLPKGGKMWYTFLLHQDGAVSQLDGIITFDLGNALLNNTLGAILERRWITLLKDSLPEVEDIQRLV